MSSFSNWWAHELLKVVAGIVVGHEESLAVDSNSELFAWVNAFYPVLDLDNAFVDNIVNKRKGLHLELLPQLEANS